VNEQQPDFTKAVDVNAFFTNELGVCGCSEIDLIIGVVRDTLKWLGDDISTRQGYLTIFDGNNGIYYLVVGALDRCGLCEHGSSIRHPWLTITGEQLLKALQTFSVEEIDDAKGEAYDGCWYGNP
jgi:hypothetical protein